MNIMNSIFILDGIQFETLDSSVAFLPPRLRASAVEVLLSN
jgi:hypothetical protein